MLRRATAKIMRLPGCRQALHLHRLLSCALCVELRRLLRVLEAQALCLDLLKLCCQPLALVHRVIVPGFPALLHHVLQIVHLRPPGRGLVHAGVAEADPARAAVGVLTNPATTATTAAAATAMAVCCVDALRKLLLHAAEAIDTAARLADDMVMPDVPPAHHKVLSSAIRCLPDVCRLWVYFGEDLHPEKADAARRCCA
jgi:hypothetical protein